MEYQNDAINQFLIIYESLEKQRKKRLDLLIEENSTQNKLKKLKSTIDSIEKPSEESYNSFVNERKDFFKQLRKDLDNIEYIKQSVSIVKPIKYISGVIPPINLKDEIHNSIKELNWMEIKKSIDQKRPIINYPLIDIFPQSTEFSEAILEHIIKIDNEEINEVFTLEFLNKITKDWWILPRYALEEYKEISKNVKSYNNFILEKYYFEPELIEDLILDWGITNEYRDKIIKQAYFNYLHGNYESCIIILMLQIEGLMKEKIDYDENCTELRIEIEKQLNENSITNNDWESFLNKANAEFILRVVKPLYDEVNFEFHLGEVKRHEIAHMGVVNGNQMSAIRLFLILDTVIYILNEL